MRKFIEIRSEKYDTNNVMVDVEYTKEYIDYWHGTQHERGIYISLVPVNVSGPGCFGCVVGQGVRCLLMPLKRKSQKQINRCEELVTKHAEELAKMYAAGDDPKVREMMRMMINVLN